MASNLTPYRVIESQSWVHVSGRTASIYGACPWTHESQRKDWTMRTNGWTCYNSEDGTVGCGRPAWSTREEAQAWVDATHARLAEYAAYHARMYPAVRS